MARAYASAMAEVRDLARHFREHLVPMAPVRVYFRSSNTMPRGPSGESGSTLDGLCVVQTVGKKVNDISVFILKGTEREMLDTLKHEWAHILAWSMTGDQDDDHGAPWGLACSQVQQSFETWAGDS